MKVSWPRIRHNDPRQRLNPDGSTEAPAHQPLDHCHFYKYFLGATIVCPLVLDIFNGEKHHNHFYSVTIFAEVT